MNAFWMSMFVFAAVLSAGLGIYHFITYSQISEMMGGGGKENIQFFESLWDYKKSGLTQDNILQYAALFAFVGAGIGFALYGKSLGLILGISGFIIGPRITSQYIRNKFKRDFFNQYPQAISRLSVALSLVPLKNAFAVVAEQLHNPARKVFEYIDRQLQNNVAPEKALADTAAKYELEEIEPLVELVELLNEVGGGEKTTDSLAALVENVRATQRHKANVSSRTGEIKNDVIITAIIIGLITAYTYADGGGEMSQLSMQYSWLICLGAGILLAGVFMVLKIIARAARIL